MQWNNIRIVSAFHIKECPNMFTVTNAIESTSLVVLTAIYKKVSSPWSQVLMAHQDSEWQHATVSMDVSAAVLATSFYTKLFILDMANTWNSIGVSFIIMWSLRTAGWAPISKCWPRYRKLRQKYRVDVLSWATCTNDKCMYIINKPHLPHCTVTW